MDNLARQDQDRLRLFKRYGYDIPKARSFILKKAKISGGRILEVGTGRIESRTLYFRGISLFKQTDIDKGSDTVTAQDIINIKNATARRECLKEFGYERFLVELKHDVIDKKEDYELVRVSWHKEEEPICLVKVKCPSTGAFYTLRVPPTTKTIKEGVAWTFGVGEKEYLLEQES